MGERRPDEGELEMSPGRWSPRDSGHWTQHHACAPHDSCAGATVKLLWYGCCGATGADSLLEPKSQCD
jgi:hypothetical protein